MKEKNFLFKICKIIGYPIFMLLFHPRILGKENILDEGLILAGNHKSNLDPILIIVSTRRIPHFFAKIELFNTKFKNNFFRKVGCIPVNRKTKNHQALEEGYNLLKDGKLVTIFPEGTTNKTNDFLLPFKIGAVKMSYETNKKILPFAITKRYKIFGSSVNIIFGKPYNLESSDLEKENKKLEQKIIKLIKEHS